MRRSLDALWLILLIAARNLRASRGKSLIAGGMIAVGALLVVLGASLTEGVDRALQGSITRSYAGHIQIYSSESKDELQVMGGVTAGMQDLATLDDFAKLRQVVGALPNVKAVVPMGISGALVTFGNALDESLARLRDCVGRQLGGDPSRELQQRRAAHEAHVRQMLDVLRGDLQHAREVADARSAEQDLELLSTASTPDFWQRFEREPYPQLEFLENRVTPLASDAEVLLLHYLGTDPTAFARAFDRMAIVDGGPIPQGEPGFLFAKQVYEEQLKLKAARGLDRLMQARRDRGGAIAADPSLQAVVRENRASVPELMLQLDPLESELLRAKLQRFLGRSGTPLRALLDEFFATTDANLEARYRFFYAELAPQLELYRVRIGDRLTISAVSRGGYVRSANLKVYGTFVFKGLERSPLAGGLNLMDLVSFRELYGFMTESREREIAALRALSGAREVSRDEAEAVLFAAPATSDEQARLSAPAPREPPRSDAVEHGAPETVASLSEPRPARAPERRQPYDPAQLQSGVVLNAAVVLHDPRQLAETATAIEAAGRRAALPLKAISWQQASGMIGQLANLMRALLYTAVLVILAVALVIINNSLILGSLERVGELGTLRAIGAQRPVVLLLLLCEAALLGLGAGAFGALLGAAVIALLGTIGIPAGTEVMTFFFSGPRLYPQLSARELCWALALALLLSVASSLYPAWLALRVSPREAMQAED